MFLIGSLIDLSNSNWNIGSHWDLNVSVELWWKEIYIALLKYRSQCKMFTTGQTKLFSTLDDLFVNHILVNQPVTVHTFMHGFHTGILSWLQRLILWHSVLRNLGALQACHHHIILEDFSSAQHSVAKQTLQQAHVIFPIVSLFSHFSCVSVHLNATSTCRACTFENQCKWHLKWRMQCG